MQPTIFYCGIDVSCDTLDICYQTDHSLEHCKVSNDVKGYKQIIKLTGKSSIS